MALKKTEGLSERYLKAKRRLFDKKYSYLNEKQREAIYTTQGPLLVLAGAGTGKTTVLTERIAFILRYGDAYMSDYVPASVCEASVKELEDALSSSPEDISMLLSSFSCGIPKAWNIIAITFTNKAAGEMKARLCKLLGDTASDINCGTFHSMCLRILRANADRIGYPSNFSIYDDDESLKVINEGIAKFSLTNLNPKATHNAISRAKDKLITHTEFDKDVGSDFKLQQIATVYTYYQSKLEEAKAVDFDDIIMKTVMLLRNNPDVLEHYRNKFKYVLIDEFQDTNFAQLELALLLSGGYGNIMVVGDDDQSIYKFRGATIENILHFDDKVSGLKEIKLEQNYRSTSHILSAANSVIRNNYGRRGKELWCDRDEGDKVLVKTLDNQNDEAKFIVNKVMELVVREKRAYSDFAVLCRSRAQTNSLENVFVRSGMPYRILMGIRFYERKEVKDILAYICVVQNPNDNLRLRRIINEPKRKIGEATLNAVETLSESTGKSMYELMKNASSYTQISSSQSKFNPFIDIIETLRDYSEKNPSDISGLISMTLDISGYMKMLETAEENGESSERRENVTEMISNAAEYEKNNEEPTLDGFLEGVSLVADIDNYDKTSDAVVVMTVHSAKGLEFPVVFLPGMEEGLFPSQQSTASPEETEEERRLAYVAATRAKDKLFILNVKERMLYGKTQYNQPSRFISEIAQEDKNEDIPKQKSRFSTEFGEKVKHVHISSELTSRSALSGQVGKTKKTGDTFTVGERVKHIMFGEGTVLSVREMGADILYEIIFDKVGTKKLMATYAKLTRV